MFDAGNLFKERLVNHMTLLNRYLRYLFNGHFMIAISFLAITLIIYYQRWLETVTDDFPASIVIALVLGFVVSYNPIQSYLKEPDKVFLIVKERDMYRYFRYALVYHYVVQLYLVIIGLAVIGPLYSQMYAHYSRMTFWLIVIVVLVMKAWNLIANWMMFRIRDRKIVWMDKVYRVITSIALLYFLLEQSYITIFVAVIYFARIVNDFYLTRKQSGLAWDVLIENDQHRLAVFYRFVSNFAEVPQLTKRVKKRRILARIVERQVPFMQSATYTYLYRLTFIRSSDYLNLYVRLTVIGGIIMYFIPNTWVMVAFAVLFLYMTSFQLIPLYQHYRTSIWIDLYPIDKHVQRQAFLKDMRLLTLIQMILFGLLFVVKLDWTGFVATLAVGGLFTYVFYQGYVKKKISR